ncbi:MAG: hypothetical protein WBH40_00740 [Ignavibacteriaceae bacterium]
MCLNLCKYARDSIPAFSATFLQASNILLSFNCFPIGEQNGDNVVIVIYGGRVEQVYFDEES